MFTGVRGQKHRGQKQYVKYSYYFKRSKYFLNLGASVLADKIAGLLSFGAFVLESSS